MISPTSELFALCRYCWHHPSDQMGWAALEDKLLEIGHQGWADEVSDMQGKCVFSESCYPQNEVDVFWPTGMPIGGPSILRVIVGDYTIRENAWVGMAKLFAVEELELCETSTES